MEPENQLELFPCAQNLLNTEEAAQYLRTQPQTLENWRCNKRYALPYVRVGRLIRYRREDLDAWLSKREIRPTGGDSRPRD